MRAVHLFKSLVNDLLKSPLNPPFVKGDFSCSLFVNQTEIHAESLEETAAFIIFCIDAFTSWI